MRRLLLLALLILGVVATACGAPAAAPAAEATEAPAAEAPATEAAPAASEAMTETTAMTETAAPAAEGAMVELPEVDPLSLSGDIAIAGSSTVYPLTEAMVARFTDEGFGGNVTVDSIGTGAGFERFCVNAETDISNASRPINDSETESCAANGREALEFRVGTDALAVVVNPENTWATDVTLEQLAKIFSSETTNWSDVDPSWPAEPIQRFSPGTDSGTFDYFVEAVMDETYVITDTDEGKGEQMILAAANLQLSEDDNILAQGVEGNKNAIGYFGFAYYQNEGSALKALTIDGIEPNAATAENGEYPLARPLFIYSAPSVITEKPQVGAFINFYLTYVNEEIVDVGYFPASEDALNAAKQALLTAMGQ